MAKSLPNLLTAGRIAAIPLLVLLLFLDGGVARQATADASSLGDGDFWCDPRRC